MNASGLYILKEASQKSLYDSTYIKGPEQANLWRQKVN